MYANRAFAEQWSIPPQLVESGDDAAMLSFVSDQLIDAAGFRQEVERLTPSDESTEDEILFKDGRIFSRRSVPCVEREAIEARNWDQANQYATITAKVLDGYSKRLETATAILK